ncbi:FMN-binding protein [Serpentinicella sp. ANB-PHB4]|uniref:FMN-binding protein n=1 Tax=Serpentinicella sp. ANB-PHB4 TaxID=3074076 RepID=UPI0028604FB1|nr:FMN-binding protein [Serpentinicella sp. ANB-PHB4]MDR5659142.1 FMN-binding protein [Serpentinicella sp. ANB-PHB4]
MEKQQKIAIILLPLISIVFLLGVAALRPEEADRYIGIGQGYGGNIELEVSMREDKITAINIIEMNETANLGDEAIEKTIEKIIDAQSTDVDTVSGATVSSEGTIEAVSDALVKHFGVEGVGQGYGGEIKVNLKHDGNEFTAIDVIEMNETENLGDNAIEKTIAQILENQTTEVDVVSGATLSSEGLIEAVENALEAQYGVEGVGQGYDGEIRVRVKADEEGIHAIRIFEINDTPDFGDSAAEEVIEAILETQSTEVDVVTGATLSSEGTIEAVEDALSKQ